MYMAIRQKESSSTQAIPLPCVHSCQIFTAMSSKIEQQRQSPDKGAVQRVERKSKGILLGEKWLIGLDFRAKTSGDERHLFFRLVTIRVPDRPMQVQSSNEILFDLSRFKMLCCFFSSRRLFFAILLTPVFLRAFSRFRAVRSSETKRSRAASRLANWLRVCCEMTRSTPSLLIRLLRRFVISSFCSGERLGELATSNQSVTRVLTLFTL